MKNKTLAMLIVTFLCISQVWSHSQNNKMSATPENNLVIGSSEHTGISEATFNSILDRITLIYTPVITALDATFEVRRNWSSGTVNAFFVSSFF